MRSPAADIGDESGNLIAVHLHGIGGRQIVGDNDRRFIDILQRVYRHPGQVAQDPLPDRVDIGTALAQVLVLDGTEAGTELIEDLLESGLRVDPAVANQPFGLTNKHIIRQDLQMRVDDIEMIAQSTAIHTLADRTQLFA